MPQTAGDIGDAQKARADKESDAVDKFFLLDTGPGFL